MRNAHYAWDRELTDQQLYRAGQTVSPGTYRQLESRRTIRLEQEDVLPASLDGHVAVYLRCPETWGERRAARC